MMEKNSKIYVAGHNGLVGSAIVRNLKDKGYTNIVTRSRSELDLLNKASVKEFFESEKPDYVFLAAAKVAGIKGNSDHPAEMIYQNLEIQNNLIHHAYLSGVKKLAFLGSTCIYPRNCPQPMKEEYFMTGDVEPTNFAYAIAKIAGIKMCEAYNKQYGTDFISVMPTNLYGINDNFDLINGHAFPTFIRRFHEAKVNGEDEFLVWGTGTTKREFLSSDDMADATVFLMNNYSGSEIVNIGYGSDIEINEVVKLMADIVGFEGKIVHDTSRPDGMPRKLVDCTKLFDMGWKPKVSLEDGIKKTYDWYVEHEDTARKGH